MWEECSLSDVYSGHLTFHMILSVHTKPNLNLLHSSLLMMILIMPLILTASSTVSLWLANYEYHTPTFFFCSFFCPLSHSFPLLALQDVDSDPDVYVQCPAPGLPRSASRQSWLIWAIRIEDSSTLTFMEYGGPAGVRETYPAWNTERQILLSKE